MSKQTKFPSEAERERQMDEFNNSRGQSTAETLIKNNNYRSQQISWPLPSGTSRSYGIQFNKRTRQCFLNTLLD